MTAPRLWTADEAATLARMARAGYSDREIAAHLRRDREVIRRQRAALGLPPGISSALVAMMARINRRRARIAA